MGLFHHTQKEIKHNLNSAASGHNRLKLAQSRAKMVISESKQPFRPFLRSLIQINHEKNLRGSFFQPNSFSVESFSSSDFLSIKF